MSVALPHSDDVESAVGTLKVLGNGFSVHVVGRWATHALVGIVTVSETIPFQGLEKVDCRWSVWHRWKKEEEENTSD